MSNRYEVSVTEIEKQKSIMRRIRETFGMRLTPALAYVDTYGCQQNEADSETLRGMLREMGCDFTSDEFAADIIVINTCAIRENAENRVLGNVGALVHTKKAKPSQIIAFCGCLAAAPETADKIRRSYRHIDLLFSPNMLWRFPELLDRVLTASGRVFDFGGEGAIAEDLPLHRDGTVKAWLPIMYGCDNFCSYCIVPHVRGRERSRRPEVLIETAQKLVSEGYKDITLLGQNVNSYGAGLGTGVDFASLIRRINDIEGEFLIRFMTSHPKDASGELFRAMAESQKAARHIHLPFQAGSDRILRLMNRGYTQSGYLEKIAAARELMPEIVITSDVIVGFPGETDGEFEDTLNLVEKARFDAMFTFIYSKRPGTPAAELPDTSTREEKQIRFDRLLEMQNSISAEKHRQYTGKTVRVLVDGESQDARYPLNARTNGGRLVHLNTEERVNKFGIRNSEFGIKDGRDGPILQQSWERGDKRGAVSDSALIGRFVDVEITHCNSWSLFGVLSMA